MTTELSLLFVDKHVFGRSTAKNILLFFLICNFSIFLFKIRPSWGYECKQSRCVKTEIDSQSVNEAVSLPVCRIFCGDDIGTLWPKPNGQVKLSSVMARLAPGEIKFNIIKQTGLNKEFWSANEERLRQQINAKVPKNVQLSNEGSRLMVMLDIEDENAKLNHAVNEHYSIETYENTGVVLVKIKAETIFGARHALETLSQLIVFDDLREELQIVGEFNIDDKPAYVHRGFLLDTARNYFSVDAIKRTIGKGLFQFNLRFIHLNV